LADAARRNEAYGNLVEQARSLWQIVETTAWLAGNLPAILSYRDGAKTLDELRDAAPRPRPGYERHHIVERQLRSVDPLFNQNRFGDRLDSPGNLVRNPLLERCRDQHVVF
jgi:hypothetical protein